MPPSRTYYAASSCATTVKQPTHPDNQEAMDRLAKMRDQANQNDNSRYGLTIKRAMDSLAACPHAIVTRKEAMELKWVGAYLAKIIVPKTEASASSSLSRSSSNNSSSSNNNNKKKKEKEKEQNDNTTTPRKRMRQTTLSSRGDNSLSASEVAAALKPKPSAKQIAYDKAVQESNDLVLNKRGWKVVLLVDGREHSRDHVQAKLQMSGVPCEQRHLPIGDMAWIAQSGNQEVMLGTIVERKETSDLAQSLFGTRLLEQRLRLQHCGLNQVLLLVEGNEAAVRNCPADTLRMAMMETRIQLNFQVVQTRHLDDTVRFLKRVHRRILQRSFPTAFGDLVDSSLPSFRSPNAPPRPRKKKKQSLVEMVMDTQPQPPRGTRRFVTYKELKARIERDREAGTKTVGAVHMAMLKQIPTFSYKKVQAMGQAYPTPSALMNALEGLSEEDGKALVKDLSTNDGAERACRIGPKSAAELYHVCTEGGHVEEEDEEGDLDGKMPARKEPDTAGTTAKKKPTAKATPKRSNVEESMMDGDGDVVQQNSPRRAYASLHSDSSDDQYGPRQVPTVASMPSTAEWECHRCTLRNSFELNACEVCGSPRIYRATAAMLPTASDPNNTSLFGNEDSYREVSAQQTPGVLNTSAWSGYCYTPGGCDSATNDAVTPRYACDSSRILSSEKRKSGVVNISQDNDSVDGRRLWDSNNVEIARTTPVVDWSPDSSPTSKANASRVLNADSVERDTSSENCASPNPPDNSPSSRTERFVTLQKAPWEESSSDDDENSSLEEESLMVRCRKRAIKEKTETKARDAASALGRTSSRAQKESLTLSCRKEAEHETKARAQTEAVEVIEID